MNKKVLIINGSRRKKNTHNVLLQIGDILKKHGCEPEIVNLSDYKLNYCRGCDFTCINNAGCNQKDDGMAALKQKILDSDALVLGSPVYLGGVTADFKTFADRTNIWFHNPETAGKPILLVTTTEVSGIKPTLKFMKSFATGLGARQGGSVARKRKTFGKPVNIKEVSKFLSLLNKDKSTYRPSMQELIIFQVQKTLAANMGGGNKQFWEEKKWFGGYYYYKCRIGLFKKMLAGLMSKILKKAIQPPKT